MGPPALEIDAAKNSEDAGRREARLVFLYRIRACFGAPSVRHLARIGSFRLDVARMSCWTPRVTQEGLKVLASLLTGLVREERDEISRDTNRSSIEDWRSRTSQPV
jgi:hypothetical protein